MAHDASNNSTNVRFLWVLSLGTASAGCSSFASVATTDSLCRAPAMLVCESFSAQRQCECEHRHDLDAFISGFGQAAWPGGRH